MTNIKLHVNKAIEYGIFEAIEPVAGYAYGKFRIADPFIDDVEFMSWKSSQKKIPNWIAGCLTYGEFTCAAEKMGGILERLRIEGIFDVVLEGCQKR